MDCVGKYNNKKSSTQPFNLFFFCFPQQKQTHLFFFWVSCKIPTNQNLWKPKPTQLSFLFTVAPNQLINHQAISLSLSLKKSWYPFSPVSPCEQIHSFLIPTSSSSSSSLFVKTFIHSFLIPHFFLFSLCQFIHSFIHSLLIPNLPICFRSADTNFFLWENCSWLAVFSLDRVWWWWGRFEFSLGLGADSWPTFLCGGETETEIEKLIWFFRIKHHQLIRIWTRDLVELSKVFWVSLLIGASYLTIKLF